MQRALETERVVKYALDLVIAIPTDCVSAMRDMMGQIVLWVRSREFHVHDFVRVVLCPKDIAWSSDAAATDTVHVESECSNRGKCDHESGVCMCDLGYDGSACQRCTYECFDE